MKKPVKSSASGPFKPYCSIPAGVYQYGYEPAAKSNPTEALKQQQQARIIPTVSVTQQPGMLDMSNKVHQVLSNTKDTLNIMKDSADINFKLNQLRNSSNQIKITAEVIHTREITQLVAFLDDFTAVIKVRVRDLQVIKFSTNIEEVLKSIQELNDLMDSKLKQFGALIADCAAWLNKQLKLIPSKIGARIGDFESRVASLLTKVPKAQLVLKGSWLGVMGLGFSLAQVIDRWKEHSQDPDSEEKFRKYIIEIIGLIIGVALLILGVYAAFIGGTIGLIVAAALLVYGIVNMVFGFKDHQDLLAEGLYWLYEEIKALCESLMSAVDGLLVQAGQAVSRLYNYLKEELNQWVDSSIDSIRAYILQKVDRILTPALWL